MKHLWVAALVVACGGPQKQPAPIANDVTMESEAVSTTTVQKPATPPASTPRGADVPPVHAGEPEDGGTGMSLAIDDDNNVQPLSITQAGTPPPSGALDKDSIRTVIKGSITRFQYCYEKRLIQNPDLEGTTVAQFDIGADGFVTKATGSGFDTEVDACVAKVFKNYLRFPAGGPTSVRYPFTFKPATE